MSDDTRTDDSMAVRREPNDDRGCSPRRSGPRPTVPPPKGCGRFLVLLALGVGALVMLVYLGGCQVWFETYALQAAGVFGRGANGQLISSVRAVVGALRDNLLGIIGASLVLVVIGLAAALAVGDQRAHERVGKLVQGILMLAAATGIVA